MLKSIVVVRSVLAIRGVLAILASLWMVCGAGPAQATDLVTFASSTSISFPMKADGLDVEPAVFPFFLLNGVLPGAVNAALLKVVRDGQSMNPSAFSATIAAPDAQQPLYSVVIDSTASGDRRTIAAGKYEITVVLWRKPDGNVAGHASSPVGSTSASISCDDCQIVKFAITREAIQLDLPAASLLVPMWRFWRGPGSSFGTAMLLEAGNKSSGRVTALNAAASRADTGDNVIIPARLKTVPVTKGETPADTDTILRSNARLLSLDAGALGPGSWTTTVRVSSDQLGGNGQFTKVTTVVRKLSTWYLLGMIFLGIVAGQLIRIRLQRRQADAAANLVAADLKLRLESLQSIQDEKFSAARRGAWRSIDEAMRGNRKTPEEIATLCGELGTNLDKEFEDYTSRRQAQRQKLVLLRDAVQGLTREAPGLADQFSDLLKNVSDRLIMVDSTLVSQAAAAESDAKKLAVNAIAALGTWLTPFVSRAEKLKAIWQQPPEIPTALDPVEAEADRLSKVAVKAGAASFWDDLVNWIVEITSLAIDFRATLTRVWFPAVRREADAIGEAAADPAARQALSDSVAKLALAVEDAKVAGEPTDALLNATRAASDDARKAEPAIVPGPGAGARGVSAGPAVVPAALPSLVISGPAQLMAGIEGGWSVTTDDPNARITWLVDDVVAGIGASQLHWRFQSGQKHKISARIEGTTIIVSRQVDVVENPQQPSRVTLLVQIRLYEWLTKAASALIITVAGWAVLEASFVGYKDLFIAFIWGFGVDLTLTAATDLRTSLIPKK